VFGILIQLYSSTASTQAIKLRVDEKQMTPDQELANAMTMVASWSVFLFGFIFRCSLRSGLLLVGSSVHLPASVGYHMNMALEVGRDRIDNDWRRLDQSFQHVAATIFAFAVSESWGYASFCFCFNAIGVLKLWHVRYSNDEKRWAHVTVGVFLYMLPLLWKRLWFCFGLASGSMLVGGLGFVHWLNEGFLFGWGHAFFHVMLVVHAYALSLCF